MFFGSQSKYTYLIAKKTSNLFKEKEVILQEHVILLTQLSQDSIISRNGSKQMLWDLALRINLKLTLLILLFSV